MSDPVLFHLDSDADPLDGAAAAGRSSCPAPDVSDVKSKSQSASLTPEQIAAILNTSASAGQFLQLSAGRLAEQDLLSTGRTLVIDPETNIVSGIVEKKRNAAEAESADAGGKFGAAVEMQSISPDSVSVAVSSDSLLTSGGYSQLMTTQSASSYSLLWKNVSVRANSSKTLLLDNVSGFISGGIHAIMSGSGGGKTTLLNTLSYRLDSTLTLESGELLLNGLPYSGAHLKNVASYVMQDDLLSGHLTVEETLHYAAYLKLPADWSAEAKNQRVDEVIALLGLSKCRSVIVGTPERKGISGGERKRLSLGIAIINRPKLLLLDEPTSGLDSRLSLEIIGVLRALSRAESVTVLCSIHQPSTRLFRLFDGLVLLKHGRILYSGAVSGALTTFERCGQPCGNFSNPADHLLDALADSEQQQHGAQNGEAAAASSLPLLDSQLLKLHQKRVTSLLADQIERWKQPAAKSHLQELFDQEIKAAERRLSWMQQFRVLVERATREMLHNRSALLIALFQAILMAVLIGTVFLQLDRSQPMVARRSAVIFFCCVNQGVFGSLTMIHTFPHERSIILRERAAGMFRVSAYFLSKSIVETIPQIVVPIVFSGVVYFLIGLQGQAENFFLFMLFMILCSVAATSVALLTSCVCKTASLSLIVLPCVFELSRLYGGFFLAPAFLPNYFSWLDALSYLKYSYVGASLAEFNAIQFVCPPAPARCQFPDGQAQITALGLDYISIGGCIGSLIAYIVGMRALAYLAIRYLK